MINRTYFLTASSGLLQIYPEAPPAIESEFPMSDEEEAAGKLSLQLHLRGYAAGVAPASCIRSNVSFRTA